MAGWAGNPSFDVFKLPEEHDELRAAIRALAEKEIAPHAADVDENSRFPQEALDALNASGFNAVHVPDEYGGQGADSVAACIVIEEVARVDAVPVEALIVQLRDPQAAQDLKATPSPVVDLRAAQDASRFPKNGFDKCPGQFPRPIQDAIFTALCRRPIQNRRILGNKTRSGPQRVRDFFRVSCGTGRRRCLSARSQCHK